MSGLFTFYYSAFVDIHSLSHVLLFAAPWTEYTRLPCPSPSPRVCSDSCPLSQWWHPTILFSVISFSYCLQSFPASGSFPMRWFFTSGGQSIGASASTSVLKMNIQGWFPLGLINQSIRLAVQWAFKSFLKHHSLRASVLWCSAFYMVQISYLYLTVGKS